VRLLSFLCGVTPRVILSGYTLCHPERNAVQPKDPIGRVPRLGASLAFPPSLGGRCLRKQTNEGIAFLPFPCHFDQSVSGVEKSLPAGQR
jgi:hypothetical protein